MLRSQFFAWSVCINTDQRRWSLTIGANGSIVNDVSPSNRRNSDQLTSESDFLWTLFLFVGVLGRVWNLVVSVNESLQNERDCFLVYALHVECVAVAKSFLHSQEKRFFYKL